MLLTLDNRLVYKLMFGINQNKWRNDQKTYCLAHDHPSCSKATSSCVSRLFPHICYNLLQFVEISVCLLVVFSQAIDNCSHFDMDSLLQKNQARPGHDDNVKLDLWTNLRRN